MKPAQVRMARAALNWSLSDLAAAAEVHRNTISNYETGKYAGDPEKLAAIKHALEAVGVEFTNGGEPGVKLVLRIGTAQVSGSDYVFQCAGRGRRFEVVASRAIINAYDEKHAAGQLASGRRLRAAMLIGPYVLKALEAGRITSDRWRLTANDLEENGAGPGVRLRK